MADTKISGLSALASGDISTVDVLPIVNADETKKVTLADLGAFIVSAVKVVADEAATSAELASVDAIAGEAATSAELASVDARITSADTALSGTLKADAVSAANAASVAAVADAKSAVAVLSGKLSEGISALETKIQTASAAAASADGHANTVSGVAAGAATVAAEAATSAELASVDARITSAANATSVAAVADAKSAVVVLSGALSDRASVLSAAIVAADGHAATASAAATSADAHAAAASAAATSVAAVASLAISTVSAVAAALSLTVSDHETRINTLSQNPGGGLTSASAQSMIESVVSVLSSKLSNISAHDAATSVKGLQSAINIVVERVSVNSAAGGGASAGTSAAVIADARSAIAVLSVDTSANITSQVAAHSTTQKTDVASMIAVLSVSVSADITSQVAAHSTTQKTDITSVSAAVFDAASANAVSIVNVHSATIMLDARSALSVHSAFHSTVSAKSATGSVKGLQTAFNAVGDRISVASAAIASAEVMRSTLSACLVSTNAVLSAFLTGANSVMSTKVSATAQKSYTWVISAPAVGGLYGAQVPATVKAVQVILATVSANTTITGNVEKRPTFGAAGSNVLSADIVGSATPVSQAADTSAGAATITAGNWLYADIAATSGTPAVGIIVLQVGAP